MTPQVAYTPHPPEGRAWYTCDIDHCIIPEKRVVCQGVFEKKSENGRKK